MLQAKMNGISRPYPQATTTSQDNKHLTRQSSFGSRPDIIGGGRPNPSNSLASSFLVKHSSNKPYKVDGENSLFDSNIQGSSGKKQGDCMHD